VRKTTRISRLHYRAGRFLKLFGWSSAAAIAYRDAIGASPLWADAHFELGECLLAVGDWGGACDALAQAVRLQPDHFEARGNLVLALTKNDRTTEALEALEALARLKSRDAEIHLLLGSLYRRAERYDDAVRAFRWAVNQPAPPAHRRWYLGEALLGPAQWKTVLESYAPAASLVRLPRPHAASLPPLSRGRTAS
jgi:tetratricopeptide (TPR) repeat protein